MITFPCTKAFSAALFSMGLAIGLAFCSEVSAASTDIANSPMAVTYAAKSNVMFVIDSSGGMDVDSLIPNYNSMYFETNSSTSQISNLDGFFYFQPNNRAGFGSYVMGFTGNPDGQAWKARYYGYNPQYYDPYVTYKPWAGADSSGIPFTNANPSAAYLDPYAKGATVNLQQWYQVPYAATYLTNHTGSSTSIPAYTTSSTIQYCASKQQTLNSVSYTKCATSTSPSSYTSYMWPASFYLWNDRNANGVMDAGEGDLYMINCSTTANPSGTPAGAPNPPPISNQPYGTSNTGAAFPDGRTCQQELQNFANWFQYSRTVMLALKGAMGNSLTVMGNARVGMTDLEHNSPVVPVADLSVPANLNTMYSGMYSIVPNENLWDQPFHERIANVWNYFNRPAGSSNPPAPIQYACQQNDEILVTPGYLNDPGVDTDAGFGGTDYLNGPYTNGFTGATAPGISPDNYDGTASSLPWENGSQINPLTGQAFPTTWGSAPYSDAWATTLADFAAYYYDQRLRTDLPSGQVPIPPQTYETNSNLHLSTFVLAPGAIPLLSSQNPPPSPLANPQTANLYPPYGPPYAVPPGGYGTKPNWPQPCFVCQSTIDDLWHTAVDGRGLFINSSNVAGGLQQIVDNILARIGASAAVAVNNANVVQGNNMSYASDYESGAWVGDLQSYPINLSTGAIETSQPLWQPSAQAQLDTLSGHASGSYSPTSRAIGTYNGTTGVGFNWTSLSPAMQALLNSPQSPPGPSDGATVLSYLRGDPTNENTLYRSRAHVLGDIIDAEPTVVLAPNQSYSDPGYQAFVSANSARPAMVYQGANDGMLHAFVAGTGVEAWAYVPGLLFNSRLSTYPNTSTLVNLSMKSGFTHLYYIDATPVAGDVDFNNTYGGSGSPNWQTIFVGGLSKGGRGYYALNITNPSAANDADVAAKALWEFPNATTAAATVANIGYSFGKPIIAKTPAAGWVVLVTSGYNNGTDSGGDGQGHLFVLNPTTGALIADLSTGVGTSASPSGLAQISAFTPNGATDDTISYVYGGDLDGNVWRFDLSGTSVSSWNVARLATLVDASGTPQPVTTVPELGLNNGYHMVYVGTGQYLGQSDIPGLGGSNANASQTQTMYGLLDNLSTTPLISPLRVSLVQQTVTTSGGTTSLSSNPVTYPSKSGWYIDLPGTGERVNTDPSLALSTLTFTTNLPNSASCDPGGSSFEYFVNFATGGVVPSSNAASVLSLGNTLASRPLLIQLPSGQVVSEVRNSNATTTSTVLPVTPSAGSERRVGYREVITQ